MEALKKLGNVSESIMIRELQKRLYGEKKDKKDKKEKKKSSVKKKEEEDREIKCVFCGSKKNLHKYMNFYYCHDCHLEIQDISRDNN